MRLAFFASFDMAQTFDSKGVCCAVLFIQWGVMTMATTYLSLFFTVVLLVTTAYFILGGLPLLVLAHDTPLDGRFIRRFFEIYYSAALFAAVAAAASYALWGKASFALGCAAIACVVMMLRKIILPAMERLGSQIQTCDPGAISGFRKIHAMALLLNTLQLVVLVWGVIQISV